MTKPPQYEDRYIVHTSDECPGCRGHRFVSFWGCDSPLGGAPYEFFYQPGPLLNDIIPPELSGAWPVECTGCGAVLS